MNEDKRLTYTVTLTGNEIFDIVYALEYTVSDLTYRLSLDFTSDWDSIHPDEHDTMQERSQRLLPLAERLYSSRPDQRP